MNVTGLALAAVLAAGAVLTTGHTDAQALTALPCDPNGSTATDAAIGQRLNGMLSKDMDGQMDAYRTSCARVITNTIKNRGLPERAAVIAVTTVIVETHLRNLDGGDRDSVGLYQQRAGWGSEANRRNATWSTNRFVNEMLDLYPNGAWKSGSIGDICQGVQRSAYPARYAVQVSDAQVIVDALWDAALPSDLRGVAAVSRDFNHLDVFAKDDDGSFLHKNWNGEKWTSGWARLGGQFRSNPAAYASGSGRIDVVGVGMDGALWHNVWTSAGGWSGWRDTGGAAIQWTPAVTSRGGGGLDVFAVDGNEQVVHRYFNGSSWTSWTRLGATATAPPAATALGSDRMNVLIRDADGTLSTRMWTRDNGWYDWIDRGEKIFGAPSVSHRSTQLMDVFVRDDADKSLKHSASLNGGTSYGGFADLGGQITTPPAPVSMSAERIDVFSRGANGHLYQRVWSTHNDGWYGWVDLGTIS